MTEKNKKIGLFNETNERPELHPLPHRILFWILVWSTVLIAGICFLAYLYPEVADFLDNLGCIFWEGVFG